VREVPVAADVVLAGVLAGPPAPAPVVLATPLAAYAQSATGLVGVLAPGAVRVPGSLLAPAGLVAALRPGDELLVGGGHVRVGGLLLAVRRWWDSAVPRVRPGALPSDVPRGVPDAVNAGALALQEALAAGGDVAPAVAGLVGLGPGLTPAGDDAVAAVLVTLVAAGEFDRAAAVRGAVRPCLHRTTTLSAALLGHAGDGRAVPQLARHLRAPADPGALAGLLGVGGSSGAALALGVRVALSSLSGRSCLSAPTAPMTTSTDREVA
jgi:hypothetical protein